MKEHKNKLTSIDIIVEIFNATMSSLSATVIFIIAAFSMTRGYNAAGETEQDAPDPFWLHRWLCGEREVHD
ncbi:MAG: hypothetical protein H6905_06790 [Hyphomicrobiales bacterium]|nr:hypothetical protein [Hyphomicrobiales bacterium]